MIGTNGRDESGPLYRPSGVGGLQRLITVERNQRLIPV